MRDVFHEMKNEGKTIVLVTHEMATVESYCHRAMLISDGKVQRIGDPGEVGRQYLRLNFEGEREVRSVTSDAEDLRFHGLWLEDDSGERVTNLEKGGSLNLRAEVEILRETPSVDVGMMLANDDGVDVVRFGTVTEEAEGPLRPGQRVSVAVRVENLLAQGRYFVHIGIKRHPDPRAPVLHIGKALDFVVFGSDLDLGVVDLPHSIETSVRTDGDR